MSAKTTYRSLNIPFTVSRNDARPLVAQVADGLRQAIACGFYKPGDIVPSYRNLAPMLGVSRIVTQAALRQIAEEGFVVSRPRIGSVVRDNADKIWRGHVVLVYPEGDDNYFQAMLAGVFRDRLAARGYLLSQACVKTLKGDPNGRFSSLDVLLSRAVDLVVVLYKRQMIFRYLSKCKVPFLALAELTRPPAGAIGFTRLDYNRAVPDFVKSCVDNGVKEIVQVYWDGLMCDIEPMMRKAGIKVSNIKVHVDVSKGRIAAVRRAGYELFSRLISENELYMNGIYFMADDYLAAGALMAMLYAGIKIPEDVRIVTWANSGTEPVYPRELTRMVFDPVSVGGTLADSVLRYLECGSYPSGEGVGPVWVEGETMKTKSKVKE